jgi:serine/threonine protein kinase
MPAKNYNRRPNFEGYRLIAEISSDAFSRVLLAERIASTNYEQPVVIKWLHATPMSVQQERDSLQREIHSLKSLHYPHIIPILAAGFLEDDNTPYLVMKYAPNGSLAERLQNLQPLFHDDALAILDQIGQALHYAHQWNITHGNLKPQNILFDAARDALLTDFHLDSLPQRSITAADETCVYTAPEQLTGRVDQQSDLYALGCLAYEMFTGHKPFVTPSTTRPGTYYRTRKPSAPRMFNPRLSQSIENAIMQAIEREPEQRQSDIPAFLAALRGTDAIEEHKQTATLPTLPIAIAAPVHGLDKPAIEMPTPSILLTLVSILLAYLTSPKNRRFFLSAISTIKSTWLNTTNNIASSSWFHTINNVTSSSLLYTAANVTKNTWLRIIHNITSNTWLHTAAHATKIAWLRSIKNITGSSWFQDISHIAKNAWSRSTSSITRSTWFNNVNNIARNRLRLKRPGWAFTLTAALLLVAMTGMLTLLLFSPHVPQGKDRTQSTGSLTLSPQVQTSSKPTLASALAPRSTPATTATAHTIIFALTPIPSSVATTQSTTASSNTSDTSSNTNNSSDSSDSSDSSTSSATPTVQATVETTPTPVASTQPTPTPTPTPTAAPYPYPYPYPYPIPHRPYRHTGPYR